MKRDRERSFERLVMPHLDAAYNLARWLLGNECDAEDAVQESVVRALAAMHTLRGEDARPWFLAIARNACRTRLKGHACNQDVPLEGIDEQAPGPDPQELSIRTWRAEVLQEAILGLPPEFREVIVLRELESMSYKEISAIAGVPIGTVMSRLGRARGRLKIALSCSEEPL